MKVLKIFLVICLSLVLFGTGEAFAARGDREEMNFGYVNHASSASDVALVSKPSYVYAVTILSTSTNAYVLLYDLTAAPTGVLTDKVAVEVGEATQYDTRRVSFDPPIKMLNGIYADVTSGSVIVEYR